MSQEFEFETAETTEMDGGNWLKEPGTYHLFVTKIEAEPTSKKGELIKNAAFRTTMQVRAGTTDGQKDKTIDLMFFNPDLSSRDKGDSNRRKITAFLFATDLIGAAGLGKGVKVDLEAAKDSQVIATLELNKYDGKSNLQLSYANIWHIDDPQVAKFPKDEAALGLLSAERRHKPEYFKATEVDDKKPEPVGATASSDVNLDDL